MALKILVVEDHAPTLELMDEVLTSLKAEVCAVGDSEEAAVLVNQQRFDGIFLDLHMPKVNGFELTQRIRASSWNKSAPIVVITASEESHAMREAFAAGATFFLKKPISRPKLNDVFRATSGKMVENRRQYLRVPLHMEVVCQTEHQSIRGITSNISEGGILLDVGRSLSPGTPVRLTFQLPGSQLQIEVTAVVARMDEKQRAGMRFTHIGARELELIRELINTEGAENNSQHSPRS